MESLPWRPPKNSVNFEMSGGNSEICGRRMIRTFAACQAKAVLQSSKKRLSMPVAESPRPDAKWTFDTTRRPSPSCVDNYDEGMPHHIVLQSRKRKECTASHSKCCIARPTPSLLLCLCRILLLVLLHLIPLQLVHDLILLLQSHPLDEIRWHAIDWIDAL